MPCPHQRNATPNCPTGRRPGHSSSTHRRHEELQTLRFGQAHLRDECTLVNWVVPPAMFRAIDLFRVLVGERSERGVSTQAIGFPLATSSAPRATVAGSAFRADHGFCDRSDRCTPDESVRLRYHAGVRSGFAWTLVLSVVVQMSHAQPPSVEALGYCGCQPGPPSVILPSRQDRELVLVCGSVVHLSISCTDEFDSQQKSKNMTKKKTCTARDDTSSSSAAVLRDGGTPHSYPQLRGLRQLKQ